LATIVGTGSVILIGMRPDYLMAMFDGVEEVGCWNTPIRIDVQPLSTSKAGQKQNATILFPGKKTEQVVKGGGG